VQKPDCSHVLKFSFLTVTGRERQQNWKALAHHWVGILRSSPAGTTRKETTITSKDKGLHGNMIDEEMRERNCQSPK
jgi:hypothetical protein